MAQNLTDERIEQALGEAIGQGELGIQVAACLHGRPIIDAWAGEVSPGGRQVDGETIFPIWSVSKAVTATAVHIQAERGLIDYDAPLARYWPEYGTNGKDAVTVRHVLSHRAGVPQMPADATPELICDWDWITGRLAEETPVFEPGTYNTYLPMTFGWLLGEIVRRTDSTGRPYARFVWEEICEPLGIDSLFFGVPPEAESRVATLTATGPPAEPPPDSLVRRAVPPAVFLGPALANRADFHASCLPAVGGISNAASLARFFALFANGGELDGVRLLSEERIEGFLEPRPEYDGHDETYGKRFPVSVGGYWLTAPGVVPPDVESPRILCHTGAGGSIAWADLDTGLSAAICHNRMIFDGSQPFAGVGDALRAIAAEAAAATPA